MEDILHVWLSTVPADAVFFSQLALIETLIFSVSMPLTAAARAPGKMKVYELILGTIQIGIFVVAWMVLRAGNPAYSVFIVAIAANILMLVIRVFLVEYLTGFPASSFFRSTILPVSAIVLLSLSPTIALDRLLPESFFASLLVILISFVLSATAMYFVGLDKVWRKRVAKLICLRLFRWQAA